ncbi:lytic transglycosylase domain-containing protein [Pseudoruegeria sp. HB172150]|uniref:lytic transglycosylase domain-containing protein n=1 Tax=Pseudoruegeria sp. HB172150 TaxID=2721164 RepID=UPI0020A692B5|nr:lytic transglycosylase domain-containing protein [Pseudoruegeria sp. HB172150]
MPDLCERAAVITARESGVPLDVLRAIALTETGRQENGTLRPWPWTVNMEGKGEWFDTRAAALAYADTHFQAGARSFDIGCFQINYRWHGHAFVSIDAMFDPLANARYAADFLARLYSETGDWSLAAGAYHSRTPVHAESYRRRFDRLRASLQMVPPTVATTPPSVPEPPVNTYPLLLSEAAQGQLGSLVPLRGGTAIAGLFGQE